MARCARCGGGMAKGGAVKKVLAKAQMGLNYGIPQTGTTNYSAPTMKKGGTHKMPNGKVMLNSKMKGGGSTKATKFAALAPPYNKATFADRIAGAKKKK